jgi:hypothetical protein
MTNTTPEKSPVFESFISLRQYYTKEGESVFLHESLGGAEWTKRLTPFVEIPIVVIKHDDRIVVDEVRLEDQGWTPIAVTEECLKPSEDELFIVVAYQREVDGKKQFKTDMRSFSTVTINEFVEKYSLKVLSEEVLNKKYHGTT